MVTLRAASPSRALGARALPGLAALAASAAALAAVAGALAAAGCVVRPDVYDRAYPCDPEAPETCAAGNACFVASAGSFCAPVCDAESACGESSICSDQNLCLDTCQDDGQCLDGLDCVLTEQGGYCSDAWNCASDADCVSAFAGASELSICSSNALASGNTCIFTCLDDTECPSGQRCVAPGFAGYTGDADPRAIGLCATDCTSTRGCPPASACVSSTALGLDASCLFGVAGLTCESDTNCLLGSCRTVGNGAGDICTTDCTTDADCTDLEAQLFGYTCDHTLPQGVCTLPGQVCNDVLCDSLSLQFCARLWLPGAPYECYSPAYCDALAPDAGCPGTADCVDDQPLDPQVPGVCLEPCPLGPMQCNEPGFGCAPSTPEFGGLANHCLYGIPWMRCVDASDCIDEADCVDLGLPGRFCHVACAGEAECDVLESPNTPINWGCTLELSPGMFYCQPQ